MVDVFTDQSASPLPVLLLRDGAVIHANDAAGALFGCPVADLLGSGLRARLLAPDAASLDDALASLGDGSEETVVRAAGDPPRKAYSVRIWRQGDLVVAELTDGTEERKLQSTVRELADIIVTIDGELVITWTPAGSAAGLGLTQADLCGVSVLDLVHPGDHPLVRRTYDQALHQPGTKGSIRLRISHPREPDVFFHASVDVVYLPDDDAIGEVLVALHAGIDARLDPDVSRSPSDRNLVETATVLPQAMLLVDHEGHVLQRNSRVRQLLGSIVESDDGRAWLGQVASGHRQRARSLVEAAASGERRTSEVIEFDRGDRVLALRVDAVPFEQHARTSSYVVHFLDVTTETEQQQRRIEYEKLAALGEMSAGVAHELNNPLNFVVNFAESVCDDAAALRTALGELDSVPDDVARSLVGQLDEIVAAGDRIAHHGRRASSIVRRMLAQITGETEWSWLDLNDVVLEAVERAGEQTSFRGAPVDATVSFGPVADFDTVHANREDLTRALTNVVSNALYAVAERGAGDDGFSPEVSVQLRDLGHEIEIVVTDNGAGIETEMIPEAFNPLFTTKNPDEGVGLGLAQCHAAVAALAGEVEIRSEVGAFTEVTIRLPKPSR